MRGRARRAQCIDALDDRIARTDEHQGLDAGLGDRLHRRRQVGLVAVEAQMRLRPQLQLVQTLDRPLARIVAEGIVDLHDGDALDADAGEVLDRALGLALIARAQVEDIGLVRLVQAAGPGGRRDQREPVLLEHRQHGLGGPGAAAQHQRQHALARQGLGRSGRGGGLVPVVLRDELKRLPLDAALRIDRIEIELGALDALLHEAGDRAGEPRHDADAQGATLSERAPHQHPTRGERRRQADPRLHSHLPAHAPVAALPWRRIVGPSPSAAAPSAPQEKPDPAPDQTCTPTGIPALHSVRLWLHAHARKPSHTASAQAPARPAPHVRPAAGFADDGGDAGTAARPAVADHRGAALRRPEDPHHGDGGPQARPRARHRGDGAVAGRAGLAGLSRPGRPDGQGADGRPALRVRRGGGARVCGAFLVPAATRRQRRQRARADANPAHPPRWPRDRQADRQHERGAAAAGPTGRGLAHGLAQRPDADPVAGADPVGAATLCAEPDDRADRRRRGAGRRASGAAPACQRRG
mmetsp:Transcript_5211/g.19452  ORF Transcript_5211/g.19452 Transcript_5211/m.19452 type:complete len:526 (+) Transcript_5211:506-2083(+)